MNTPNVDAQALLAGLDLEALARLNQRLDLGALVKAAAGMSDAQLKGLTRLMSATPEKAPSLPTPNADFFGQMDTLTQVQRDFAGEVRGFMHTHVSPIMNEYWNRDEFPRHLIPELKKHDFMRRIWNEDGSRTPTPPSWKACSPWKPARWT
ncbi:acyl-CoA dehydrogenase family protein [Deinococcus aquaticus]|uniref:acyl-CoA dehydrogenase family protein n=1 Tax=Deinococcus aquaticus TaxID=328692 RepID=UPI003617ECC1